MYNGPSQQFPPQPQPGPHPVPGSHPAPSPRRGGTGRTIGITLAATVGVYALVAGGIWLLAPSSASVTGPEFEGLPGDPCAVPTGSQLNSLSARMPSAQLSAADSRCSWSVEYSDGTRGSLNVRYWFPTDDDNQPKRGSSEVEEAYEDRAEQLLDGTNGEDDYWTVEVQESHEPDFGDQAVVSHFREGYEDLRGGAEVLVLADGVLIEVAAKEVGEETSGRPDFTGDEDTLVAVAERAVAHLE
ncbi:hypothetical protein [Nocardiopsis ganjiahuensis]|uniref:hypothetical protein n=1 Tax=Nocardiopsis ganjiahuensis TaxID=239984 RepID=UPI0003452FA4|nr:hypothetical protein [Nocardiopsis ganjiahuensis]